MKKMYLGMMGHRDANHLKDMIKTAIDAGYHGIDSAKIYGNEDVVGQALTMLKNEGTDVKVQTKIWTADFKETRKVFEEMLKNLQVNKVHSLLLHRPSINFYESIDAWKELIELKKEGKVEHIGVSNFDKDMVEILIKETGVTPEFNQIEMSLTNFRDDRLHYNNSKNIEVQGWSAMGKNPSEILNNPTVKKLAQKHNVSEGCIALSFLTTQNIVPIIGTSKVERVKENAHTIELSKDEICELMSVNKYENKFEETYPY